jgi:hypothetical protein
MAKWFRRLAWPRQILRQTFTSLKLYRSQKKIENARYRTILRSNIIGMKHKFFTIMAQKARRTVLINAAARNFTNQRSRK